MTSGPVLLGAHLSIAGGIDKAFYAGASIGCTALQIFTHSNRQWAIKDLSQDSIEAVKKAQQETGIKHPFVHASYLINIGSEKPAIAKKSAVTLVKELQRCSELNIPYLILHPGSGGTDKKATITQISTIINEVLDHEAHTTILIELMAGQGNSVGATFEELALMKKGIRKKKRIGFCIDTCHLWAAGYDFSDEKGYHKVWKEFNTILGYEDLGAIHINDSKNPLGSHVDRHQEIGKGTIGIEAFRLLMNDSHLQKVPKILETPKKELTDYAHNMKLLKSLIS